MHSEQEKQQPCGIPRFKVNTDEPDILTLISAKKRPTYDRT